MEGFYALDCYSLRAVAGDGNLRQRPGILMTKRSHAKGVPQLT